MINVNVSRIELDRFLTATGAAFSTSQRFGLFDMKYAAVRRDGVVFERVIDREAIVTVARAINRLASKHEI